MTDLADNFVDGQVGAGTGLRAARCDRCGRHQFPHRAECPACLAPTVEVLLEGPARLVVSTTIEHPPPGGKVEVPYYVGVAEFPEGIRVIGLLTDRLPYGSTVRPEVVAPFEGARTFAFAPAER